MQFYIFSISATGDPEREMELNHFLRSHRVVDVRKELVNTATNPMWTFCVECLDHTTHTAATRSKTAPQVDYKEVLSPEDFSLYQTLRDKRKELAKEAGTPVWSVANNAHIAAMAQERSKSKADLSKIDGFGESKIEKYGQAFLDLIPSEKKRQPD